MYKVLSDLKGKRDKFKYENKGSKTNVFMSEQKGFSLAPEKGAKHPHLNLMYHYFPEEK